MVDIFYTHLHIVYYNYVYENLIIERKTNTTGFS